MSEFHKMTVQNIRHDTADSVVVTLRASTEAKDAFNFKAGQYLTFRHQLRGEELRRNYSISSAEGTKELEVGIRKVEGGVFSSFANDELKKGDELEVLPPEGRFTLRDIKPGAHVLMIATGSGITPMISHIETLLSRDPTARISLIYGNRTPHSIMFRERLEELKSLYMSRFHMVHVLSRSGQEAELLSGRITGDRTLHILDQIFHERGFDAVLICGQIDMTNDVRAALIEAGLSSDAIRYELFNTGNAPKKTPSKSATKDADIDLTVIIDGVSHALKMNPSERVLDVARANNIDAPFSCKGGICSTCRCKILEGNGEMEINHALEDYEVEAGYALSCQLSPTSDKLTISYDEGH